MPIFSGTYHSKLDRGRCFFPAAFRKELPDAAVVRLKVRVTEDDAKYLEIYTDEDWKKMVADLKRAIGYDPSKYDEDEYEKRLTVSDFTGSVEDIEIELKSGTNPANVGRIMIPKTKLTDAEIGNEVTFVGTDGMVLVWDKKAYENRQKNLAGDSLKSRMLKFKQKQSQSQSQSQ